MERSINNLSEFINHFKHAQTQANPKEEITAKPTEIRTLFATSFSPANDERIRNWINYPGVSTAIRRSREITDLVTDVSMQPPQGLSNSLDPGSTLHDCVQEIIQLSQLAFESALAIANSQAGPIVVSILAPVIKKADEAISEIKGSNFSPRPDSEWASLFTRTTYLIT